MGVRAFALRGVPRTRIDWLLVGAVMVAVPSLAVLVLGGQRAVNVCVTLSGFTLVVLLTVGIFMIGGVPRLGRPAARFWRGTAYSLVFYSLGMASDAAVQVLHSNAPGLVLAGKVFLAAGSVLSMYAMFQYPTTARTRGERITVSLDVSIVLLATAAFCWYFSVGAIWTPSAGYLTLAVALAPPAVTLVAGFGMLKIAFVGAGVIARWPLACFALSAALSAVSGALPVPQGGGSSRASGVIGLVCQLVAILGTLVQYRASIAGRRTRQLAVRRRAFSVLPFAASLSAFTLLVVVLGQNVGWREWGVVVTVGLLLCVVTMRQLTALRENARLLASNGELTAQLQRQAWYDELTGLANRTLFGERIRAALDRCRQDGSRAAVLLVDLDDFKVVNDTLGHEAGDDLLRTVAQRLTAAVRPTDVVCRLGGDEFVVIAEDVDDLAAGWLADRIVQAATEPVPLGELTATVGASVGVALTGPTLQGASEILRNADIAMYRAKAAGKCGWRHYEQHHTHEPAIA